MIEPLYKFEWERIRTGKGEWELRIESTEKLTDEKINERTSEFRSALIDRTI